MNPPANETELNPEKLEEEKEGGALFHCDLYDADIVHKIAQEFLPGLASACVDNTTGGLFRNPASVAVDLRREMVDYLIQRSENFVAESVVLEGGPSVELPEDPYDIISDFIDDFASSKRNFFSRVSGWLLSERREDRIDDFVQEMEISGFWLLSTRESVAQNILKNVDFKNMYHCSLSFKSTEEVEVHKLNCGFRTIDCLNEGCNFRFSAAQMEQHDQTCPFKIILCEQNCSESLMRRDMDRHCITVCPMKLVKCPFYSVGCHSSVPQRMIEQHRSESLDSHLLCILQLVYKEAKTEDLQERVEQLARLASPGKLAAARDARSLTFAIKDLDAKLGPLKIKTAAKSDNEVKDLTDEKEGKTILSTKVVGFVESPSTNTETANSAPKVADYNKEDENEKENENISEKEKETEDKNDKEMEIENAKETKKETEKEEKKLVEPLSCVTKPPLEPEPHMKREDSFPELSKANVLAEKPSEGNTSKLPKYESVQSPSKSEEPTDSVAERDNNAAAQDEDSTKYREETRII